MAVTKSWATQPAFLAVKPAPKPRGGLIALACASLFVAGGLLMVYAGKTHSLAADHPVNLNAVVSPDELLPLLESFPDRTERQSVAGAMFALIERKRPLPNVGALAPLRRTHNLPLARLKPLLAVRTAAEFQREFPWGGASLWLAMPASPPAFAGVRRRQGWR